ncbi:MAG TPA: polysaccharide biosynthesis C-terminal domain-containing protein [Mycobacteriales bacterium]|nr:polysaccharide biosynthesis C-terminal domain-containing protein [Mycobacteriales bacterium]
MLQRQAARLVQLGLAFVASVIIARTLGPRGAGLYAAVLALVVLAQGLASFGLEDLVLARGPALGVDSSAAREIYAGALRLRLWTGALFLVAAACIALFASRDPLGSGSVWTLASAAAYAGFNGVASLGSVIEAARFRAGSAALLDTTWSVLVTAAFAGLAATSSLTVVHALVATAGTQFAVSVWYLAVLREVRSSPRPVVRLRELGPFWLNGLLSIGVGKTADVLAMRAAGAGAKPTGFYSTGYNAFQTGAQSIVEGLGLVSYVGLGRVFGSHASRETVASSWRLTALLALLVSSPVLAGLALYPDALITGLYGSPFAPAARVVRILAISAILARTIGGGSSQSLLLVAGRQRTVVRIRGVLVIANVIGDVVLYRALGITGVAISTCVSGFLIGVAELVVARRIAPVRPPLRAAAVMTSASIAGGWLLSLFVKVDRLVLVVAAVVLAGVAHGAALLAFKPIRSSDITPAMIGEGRAARLLRLMAHD